MRLVCQRCNEFCLRNPYSDKWYHEEDYVHLSDFFRHDYDHDPVLDVVDVVEIVDDSSCAPTRLELSSSTAEPPPAPNSRPGSTKETE